MSKHQELSPELLARMERENENMSYAKCPDCGKEIKIFGESHIDSVAMQYGIPVLAKLPIDPEVASACDRGEVETVSGSELEAAASLIAGL